MSLEKDLFFAQQSLSELFLVVNKLQIRGEQYLQDLTIRQMLAIPAIIYAPKGEATLNYIAREMGTTKQSVKQIVDIMVKKGYVFVEVSKQDKRAVNVIVTEKGSEAFRECSGHLDIFLADIFCDFSSEDLEMLCNLLKKLYRFDGVEPINNMNHAVKHENQSSEISNDILKFHQKFVNRRMNKNE